MKQLLRIMQTSKKYRVIRNSILNKEKTTVSAVMHPVQQRFFVKSFRIMFIAGWLL